MAFSQVLLHSCNLTCRKIVLQFLTGRHHNNSGKKIMNQSVKIPGSVWTSQLPTSLTEKSGPSASEFTISMLVICEDPLVQRTLCRALERFNVNTTPAEDAAEARGEYQNSGLFPASAITSVPFHPLFFGISGRRRVALRNRCVSTGKSHNADRGSDMPGRQGR